MPDQRYIGRQRERKDFARLLDRREAQLVTCQGRRRIGKSRLITECADSATHFISISGLAPREDLTREDQLENFAAQLRRQVKVPRVILEDWTEAFDLLHQQLPTRGKLVILLDEISWMAIGDKDFAGYLKTAWDDLFSKRKNLIMVLCGSVSSWIEKNILNSTGFVGRCSWHFRLKPLPLSEAILFWGKNHERISLREKLDVIGVTGCIPGYLREIDPKISAEKNIERLCFHPSGMLFHEFDSIFHDIFQRRAGSYREIVATLITGPKSTQQVSRALGRARGGSLADSLIELEQAGFITRDVSFDPTTGKNLPRTIRYRLSDCYLRFYLKYVEPNRTRIEKEIYQRGPLETLTAWDTIMGLQFETMVLHSLRSVYTALELDEVTVLNAGPYFQTQTQRRQGCQIDLLIRTKAALYVVEIKRKKNIGLEVISEVAEKIKRLAAPKSATIRSALIYQGDLHDDIAREDDFDFLIPAESLL